MKKIRIIAAANAKGEYLDWRELDLPIIKALSHNIIGNVVVQGKGTFLRHGNIDGAINVLLTKEQPTDIKGIDLVTADVKNIPNLLEMFPDKYVYVVGGYNVISALWDKADIIQLIVLSNENEGKSIIPILENMTLASSEECAEYRYEMWRKKKENGLLPKYLRRK